MKKHAWIWKTGRILLAVVLLAAVFKWTVKLTDTVGLANGETVQGTITAYNEDGVTIESSGETDTYAPDEIALDEKGVPAIKWGLIGLLKRMNISYAILALALLGVAPFVASVRWRMLLAAQDIRISIPKAIELTFLGLFFNNFMPGLTGGDVIKAYYAAKLASKKKTHAVVTVFLDRLIGLVALAIVAGVAIVAGFGAGGLGGGQAYQRAAWFVVAFIIASFAGAFGFYSRRLRGLLSRLVKALPGYGKVRGNKLAEKIIGVVKHVDDALFLYRGEKMVLVKTTAISFVAHTGAILSIYLFGRALGITQASLMQYFVVVPVCFILSSVPSTPGAWGVGEVVFQLLFGTVGVPGTAAVTLSVIYRLSQAIWTLPGGVILMFSGERETVEQLEREIVTDEGAEETTGGEDTD